MNRTPAKVAIGAVVVALLAVLGWLLRPGPGEDDADTRVAVEQAGSPPAPTLGEESRSAGDAENSTAPATTESEERTPGGPVPPVFDVVRVSPDGQTVIAGRAAPDTRVEILLDGEVVATVETDASGAFATVLDLGVSGEARELVLRVPLDGTEARRMAASGHLAPSTDGAAAPDALAPGPAGGTGEVAAAGQADAARPAPATAQPGASGVDSASSSMPASPGSTPTSPAPTSAAGTSELAATASGMAAPAETRSSDAPGAGLAESAPSTPAAAGTEPAAAPPKPASPAMPEDAGRSAAAAAPGSSPALSPAPSPAAQPAPSPAQPSDGVLSDAGSASGAIPDGTDAGNGVTGTAAASAPGTSGAAGGSGGGAAVAVGRPSAPAPTADIATTVTAAAPKGPADGAAQSARVTAPAPAAEGALPSAITGGTGAEAPEVWASGGVAAGDRGALFAVSEPVVILPPEGAEAPPVVLAEAPDGVRLLQPAVELPEAGMALDRVTYLDAGEIVAAGRGRPGMVVRVYANAAFLGEAVADEAGNWEFRIPEETARGTLLLRFDAVDEAGRVVTRLETPFEYAPSAVVQELRERKIVVQKGDYLWKFARQYYGKGIRYSVIYKANAQLIRDPDLIYPGQVFTIPELVESEGTGAR